MIYDKYCKWLRNVETKEVVWLTLLEGLDGLNGIQDERLIEFIIGKGRIFSRARIDVSSIILRNLSLRYWLKEFIIFFIRRRSLRSLSKVVITRI